MCGLVGVMGLGIQHRDMKMFRDLLGLSTVRGFHSTGVAFDTLHGTKRPKIIKEVVNGARFADYYEYTDLTDASNDIVMGHTRWATAGVVTEQNAHPFRVGPYIGAHNGTLTEWRFHKNKKTDSENMIAEMTEKGIKETLESLDSNSAYAVSIWDIGNKTLTLARNKKRTLFLAQHTEKDVLFWASEARFLVCSAMLVNELDKFNLFEVPAYTMLTLSPRDIKPDLEFKFEELRCSQSPLSTSGSVVTDEVWDDDAYLKQQYGMTF